MMIWPLAAFAVWILGMPLGALWIGIEGHRFCDDGPGVIPMAVFWPITFPLCMFDHMNAIGVQLHKRWFKWQD